MKTLSLILLALRYHWDAQKSNPANLFAATIGMVINNTIVLWGLWAMLFDGKPDGRNLTVYFLALNSMITVAWGCVCFFLGGVRSLGEYIEDGTLEPMLATPRDPLLLAGISQSIAPALGDILQGLCCLAALFYLAPLGLACRGLLFTSISAIAFLGLFILLGSLPFFIRRGNPVAQLLIECTLSLSYYPTGKVFTDNGRIFLYLTPAAVTAILPIGAVDSGTWEAAAMAIGGAGGLLWLSIKVFHLGLKRYQAASYVLARA